MTNDTCRSKASKISIRYRIKRNPGSFVYISNVYSLCSAHVQLYLRFVRRMLLLNMLMLIVEIKRRPWTCCIDAITTYYSTSPRSVRSAWNETDVIMCMNSHVVVQVCRRALNFSSGTVPQLLAFFGIDSRARSCPLPPPLSFSNARTLWPSLASSGS